MARRPIIVSDAECQPTFGGGGGERDRVSECNQPPLRRRRKFIAVRLAFFITFLFPFSSSFFIKKTHYTFSFPLPCSPKLTHYLEA